MEDRDHQIWRLCRHKKKKIKAARVRKSNISWTPDKINSLIENVQAHENLWNPCHRSYKDRNINLNSWESVAEAVLVPKQEALVKWNSMRSNYRLYLKNQRYSKSGQAAKNKNTNPIFVATGFLEPILKFDAKHRESNLELLNDSSMTDSPELNVEALYSEGLPAEAPKRTRRNEDNEGGSRTSTMLNKAYEMLVNLKQEDEWDALGNMVASNGRTWSDENQNLAKRFKAEISAVIAKYATRAANMKEPPSTSPAQVEEIIFEDFLTPT